MQRLERFLMDKIKYFKLIYIKLFFLLLFVLVVSSKNLLADEDSIISTLLYFEEKEPGLEPGIIRFIANDRYLRIDDGKDKDDFILFDQAQGIVFNITHTDRSVLEIKPFKKQLPASIQKKLMSLKLNEEKLGDANLPSIAGMQPQSFKLLANGKVCTEVSSVKGLLKDVVTILYQYQRILSNNNRNNLSNMPTEFISDCMLANDVLGASRYLDYGLPIVWSKENGSQRFLMDYKKNQKMQSILFIIPEKYAHYSPAQLNK